MADFFHRDSLRPCPESCAFSVSEFDVDGIPGAFGVRRFASEEAVQTAGTSDERPYDSYAVFFADGDFAYDIDLGGPPGRPRRTRQSRSRPRSTIACTAGRQPASGAGGSRSGRSRRSRRHAKPGRRCRRARRGGSGRRVRPAVPTRARGRGAAQARAASTARRPRPRPSAGAHEPGLMEKTGMRPSSWLASVSEKRCTAALLAA
jgi:hypothetical protein